MRKPCLCTQNTPHITVYISFTVYDFRNLYKLHEIAYENLHEWCKYIITLQTYDYTFIKLFKFEIQKCSEIF